jgi:hypothetical protein
MDPQSQPEKKHQSSEEVEAEQKKMALKLGLLTARAEMRFLAKWVKQEPCSVRVVGFLAAAALFVSAVWGFVLNVLSLQIQASMINFWQIPLSLLAVFVEIPLPILEEKVHLSRRI